MPPYAKANTIVQLFLFHASGVIAGDREGIENRLKAN